jgi:hypothetical protein
MKYKKGQVWKTPEGHQVTIAQIRELTSFPVRGFHVKDGKTITRDYSAQGHFLSGGFSDRAFDLAELVSDVGRWYYGTSDDRLWEGPCDTLEQAKEDAYEHFLEREEECQTYYFGEAEPYILNMNLAGDLLERIVETIGDETCEDLANVVDEAISAISELDKDAINTEVNACLNNWLAKHCPKLELAHFPGKIHEATFQQPLPN